MAVAHSDNMEAVMPKFSVLETKSGIAAAISTLKKQLKDGAVSFQRRLSFPGAGDRTFKVYWRPKEKFWACIERGGSQYWCCYGIEDPRMVSASRPLHISCQINPPLEGANAQCAGVIALDDLKRILYAHSGRLGGGGPATGMEFGAFLQLKPVTASRGRGHERSLFLVGEIGSADLPSRVGDYVYQAAAFRSNVLADPAVVEEVARRLESKKSLRRPKGQRKPRKVKLVGAEVYMRDARVMAYVRRQAKGRCEACSKKAPFKSPRGSWFLEVHHLRWLSQGGSDRVENAVALCPNCHRALHHGADANDRLAALYKNVKRLKKEPSN